MLDHFFRPRAVAVVGASRTPGKVGYDILKNLLQYKYPGELYPVNPAAKDILGKRTHPSLTEIDGKVDLAGIAVPPAGVRKVIAQ